MVRLFVVHTVEDYERWRRVYDAYETTRAEMGVRDAAVFRAPENPNHLTVTHDFDSLEAAKSFFQDSRLMAAMEDGGIIGPPQATFGEQV